MALEAQLKSRYMITDIIYKLGRWPNLTLVTNIRKQNLIITGTDQSLGIPAPLISKPPPITPEMKH